MALTAFADFLRFLFADGDGALRRLGVNKLPVLLFHELAVVQLHMQREMVFACAGFPMFLQDDAMRVREALKKIHRATGRVSGLHGRIHALPLT